MLFETVAALRDRFDGWLNTVSGAGTDRDRTTYGSFYPDATLTDIQLSNLYHHDDIAARAVDLVPREMTREPFEVDTEDEELDSAIAEKFEELGVRNKFKRSMIWGRLFGGAATLIGADDRLSAVEPLRPERAKDIEFLYTIDRRQLQPYTIYSDIGNPKLGQVETYLLMLENELYGNQIAIHESRLIMWGGAITGGRERRDNSHWDYSVLQRLYNVLRQFASSWQSIDSMLSEANQNVVKIAGLHGQVGKDGQAMVSARTALMDMYRSVFRALVLDAGSDAEGEAEEKFERFATSFADVPQLLDKIMLRLAAALQIPVTILMGQSPAGMNATGESDFRWFYDGIRSDQHNVLTPRIRRLAKTWFATKAGPRSAAAVKNVTVKYAPLWTPTPQEEAKRRLDISVADDRYITNGTLRPEQVMKARFRPEGFSSDIIVDDDAIQAADERLKRYYAGNETGSGGQSSNQNGADVLVAGGPGMVPPKPPAPGAQQQAQPPTPTLPAARQDAADEQVYEPVDLVPELKSRQRVVIAGAAECGKSWHAAVAGERYGRKVLGGDRFIGLERDRQTEQFAADLDRPGAWIVEGTAAVLGIRKWLADNPDKTFPAAVVWLDKPVQHRNQGQFNQAKGIATVWSQVRPELERRGATIIERRDH